MLKKNEKIGEYLLLQKIGSGGFGDVWRAEKRTALDLNYFALKFFRPKDEKLDLDGINKEIGVWKQLKGLPHIISIIELDQFEDYIYVVSDFADGGSLESWLKKNGGKAPSQAEAVKIILEILTGLENLHDKGFVHRDLKPDNILILNGKFCLADFGISRQIKTQSKATGTAGTMEFMPPEAFARKPSVAPQTDIWAAGVILQKLLTGELPYPQDDIPALIAAITMFEPNPMPANISEGLREIVKKTLQKESRNRFQTAREMREALRNPEKFLATLKSESAENPTADNEEFTKTKEFEVEVTQDLSELEADDQSQTEDGEKSSETEKFQRETEEHSQEQKEKDTSKQKQGETTKDSVIMGFVRVSAGSFMMGSPSGENDRGANEDQHQVSISRDFYIGKYQVTQAQWKSLMGTNPSKFQNCDNCPVENVSWEDAQEFIKKLNAKGDGTYRLPSEAEWEYAARAGSTTAFAFGNSFSSEQANFDGNYPSGGAAKGKYLKKTTPVGSYRANPWGLYDMHGNVWEWCQDWFGDYPKGAVTDPAGPPSGSARWSAGGAWSRSGKTLRSASRSSGAPSTRSNGLGFRLVRES